MPKDQKRPISNDIFGKLRTNKKKALCQASKTVS
jgi:hypothetical protein